MLRRVTSAVLAVVVAGLVGVVGVPPQPAHAFPGVSIFVQATFSISATFNFGGSNAQLLRAIEQAKQEIIAEINASEARILAHIDQSEAANVATCIRAAGLNLRRMDRVPADDIGERIAQARHATECAIQAGQFSRTVATLSVADYLGYATAEAHAIAAVLSAWAGLDLQSLLTEYISDYERLIERLEPRCETSLYAAPDPVWLPGLPYIYLHTCSAYNGNSAEHYEFWTAPPEAGGRLMTEFSAPVDWEALRQQAMADTSWVVARDALPRLRQALAMIRRDFVVAAAELPFGAQPGGIRYWSEDGPLAWVPLRDDPGRVTALAAGIEPSDRRHYVAIIDGRLWHRMRNGDGSWGPWGDQGIAATAVSAAADPSRRVHLHVTAIIDGVVYHRARVGEGVWTNFQAVPGGHPGVVTAVGSTVDPSGRLHLLSVVDGQLGHQMRNTDGSWTGWGSWGVAATRVSAAAQADGKVHVAAVINGQAFHRLRIGEGVWTDFAPVTGGGLPSGSIVETVTSAIDPAGNYQLAVVAFDGVDDVFLRTRFPSGSWSQEWVRLGIHTDFFQNISAIAAS